MRADNDNRPERSFEGRPSRDDDHRADKEPEKHRDHVVARHHRSDDHHEIEQQKEYDYGFHRLPPRSTDAIQPVRLGRREIERVHVLMGILDRRSKK